MRRGIFLAVAASTACGLAAAEEARFDLAGFDEVSVGEGVTAIISVGGDFSVRADGDQEALERLDVKVVKDELRIGRKSRWTRGRAPKVTVNVSLPALNSLDVSTGSETTATGIAAGRFSMDASTGATAEVSGSCDDLSLDVSTGAEVEAKDLQCKTANVDASLGGTATIFASGRVSADASFGGEVTVHGGPAEVSKGSSFGGEISVVK